jgi:hypothetical protein
MFGSLLSLAAGMFWCSWALMPGVGVTDPAQIFELVSSQRSLVAISVVVQLISAVLYVPALLGVLSRTRLGHIRGVRWGAALLIVGAMGSAADAVLHLLAYAMTAPGLDRATLVPVMAFMQGPGLVLLAPLILSFFLGGPVLAAALARVGSVSHWNAGLYGLALAVAVAGAALAAAGLADARLVGLGFLGVISAAQIWTGLALSTVDVAAQNLP